MSIKYGVIGAGFFGEKHIEVLSSFPNVEIAGVSRRSIEPLKEIAKRYNIPNIYTDYRELLSNEEIEVVSITTHAKDHLLPTIDAIKAGKHIFLEKPMALITVECDKIIEALKTTDKFFMVGHICRFDPSYAIAKKSIDEGKIGKIVSIYARRNIPAGVSESVLEKISPITGDGIHDTDLMLWYTKAKVKSVYAQTVNVRNLPYPDIGWAMYRFETGAVGVIENVWFLPEKTPYNLDAKMEIIGDKGAIYINSPGESLSINTNDGWEYPETVYWPEIHNWRTGALKEELSYFINCITSGKKPEIITPQESREAVRVVESAEKSANEGKVINLKY